MKATAAELRYWAAVFDWRGRIGFRANRGARIPFVALRDKDEAKLADLPDLFGGRVRYGRQDKTYVWDRTTYKAQAFLREIFPYTRFNRDVILSILHWKSARRDPALPARSPARAVLGAAMSGSADLTDWEKKRRSA